MSEFQLDTFGAVTMPFTTDSQGVVTTDYGLHWRNLDAFTQGYIEALFFTECDVRTRDGDDSPGNLRWNPETESAPLPADVGFSDISPEAMARIGADCEAFQALPLLVSAPSGIGMASEVELSAWTYVDAHGAGRTLAGRDFLYTRNGHGCGFWDGDWPEPYASALTTAAKGFGEVYVYLGDDGRVHLA